MDIFTNSEISTNENGEVFEYRCGCMESYPCQHYVKKHGEGNFSIMYGNEIYEYLKENGYDVPEHFRDYAGFNLVNWY